MSAEHLSGPSLAGIGGVCSPETRSPLGGAHRMCAQLCSEFVEFLAWILLVFLS